MLTKTQQELVDYIATTLFPLPSEQRAVALTEIARLYLKDHRQEHLDKTYEQAVEDARAFAGCVAARIIRMDIAANSRPGTC